MGNRTVRGMVLTVVAVSCGGANHETLGDRAYEQRSFAEALVEYQWALEQDSSDAGIRRKTAHAALRARDLVEAARQFRALATIEPDRTTEAADGLERVARAALSEVNRAALLAALDGLRDIASGRAVGSFARELAAGGGELPQSEEEIAVLPVAAAGASDARRQDSTMFVYGVALVGAGDCRRAVPVFESLLRRERVPNVLPDARERAARCAVSVGRERMDDGIPTEGEEWLRRAIEVADGTEHARMAWVLIGDILFGRGAYAEADSAFTRAIGAAIVNPVDSISVMASQRRQDLRDFILFTDTAQTLRDTTAAPRDTLGTEGR